MFKLIVIFLLLSLSACSNDDVETQNHDISKTQLPIEQNEEPVIHKNNINFELLHKKIAYGKASIAEVRQALTDKDIGNLTNVVHALYSMRWHRAVQNLLDDMWTTDTSQYPELSWELIGKTPVKLAIASTINRIKIIDTDEYKNYLYSHKEDEHEFHRAQVVIALAFNGDPADVEYLTTMADSDNHYVTQSAITGLAIMGGETAKKALGSLWKKHKENPRGKLIEEVLKNAYDVEPSLNNPADT